ncbi:hypothetical protein [Pontibacter sp. G13]|uniref:hypothetical protein n=1 Tax=Pontibacter sp. G13 TaxID=3074898 RepID=UPI0028895807|nr:hypothetical protein [Pontibacter sp. G13]WNJ19495.1 hypothetical protein RJD25_03290 [Pontibacter sp. G13]
MKSCFLILCLMGIVVFGFAQSYATFSVDSTIYLRTNLNPDDPVAIRIRSQTWVIRGQKLSIGLPPVRIPIIPNKLDTIYYRGYRQANVDTLITRISEPAHIQFSYNECCGAFNVRRAGDRKYIRGAMTFSLSKPDSASVYMGSMDEVGVEFATDIPQVLHPACRSAMSPNVYRFAVSKVEWGSDSTNLHGIACLQQSDGSISYNPDLKVIEILARGIFMPLDEVPFQVVCDPKTGQIRFP